MYRVLFLFLSFLPLSVLSAQSLESVTAQPGAILTTASKGGTLSRLEAEKRYRACLFAYLPQVGSDVAAELIRNACADEFLRPARLATDPSR